MVGSLSTVGSLILCDRQYSRYINDCALGGLWQSEHSVLDSFCVDPFSQ